MIFYFSGTGNCKYVAEQIAASLNDQAMSIEKMPANPRYKLKDGEVFGMVSPTYSLQLPENVKEFLENLMIEKSQDNYLFHVATYGTTPGASGAQARHILREKGIKLDALYSIIMPDNWTPVFDLSNPKKVAKINEKAGKQLEQVIKMLSDKTSGNHMSRDVPYAVRIVTDISYQNMRKTANFNVEDTCIGCSLCEKKCPVQAIRMKNGKPVWVKEKCVVCLRCLHHCPKFAIQYGKNTKKHGQYTNAYTRV